MVCSISLAAFDYTKYEMVSQLSSQASKEHDSCIGEEETKGGQSHVQEEWNEKKKQKGENGNSEKAVNGDFSFIIKDGFLEDGFHGLSFLSYARERLCFSLCKQVYSCSSGSAMNVLTSSL